MIPRMNARQLWPLSFLVCVIAVTLSFAYLDMPMAHWFLRKVGRLDGLGNGLGSAVLLSLEAATVLTLVIARLLRGHLSRLSEAVALASLTSMCSYAVNSGVLKVFFGVPNPGNVLTQGAHHSFHLLAGAPDSSFPSGHMVLACAFAGVIMKLYPRSIWPLAALLSFGAALLVYGDWHFASDVIAGAFVGISAGLLAGELWLVHSS
ncbi:MAG: phosphatase PAP2 family protein [Alphaproteobacteria bacterium]|nr:phosphatase PAP2 family protein [Alphaproteobacteria bacterium]MDE2111652.1 phosphatase PAP2 family protein [Alphaproteobacteria bacterium]MDE2494260.1 phosphatase PAP2 family protein [Alphaproteobacteria bacterium]